jgi:flagellar hook protein FlgE
MSASLPSRTLRACKALGCSATATTRQRWRAERASIAPSGSAGLGTLQGGAIEQSNVNISQEFSNLLIAQRAFEANSKTVTTFDTVTQETINMIR